MTRIARRNAPSFELALEPRVVYSAAAQPAAVTSMIRRQNVTTATATAATTTSSFSAASTSSFGASSAGSDAFAQLNTSAASSATSSASSRMPSPPQWTIFDGPSKITSNLYLGSQSDAADVKTMKQLGIKRILNVAGECEVNADLATEFLVKHVALRDHSDENISAHFDECVAFIREAVVAEEPILVHCRMGVSRSTTIVLAYIMRYGVDEGNATAIPYTAAFDFVKALRPQVSPNLGFVLSLHQLDRDRGYRTPDEDMFESPSPFSASKQQHLF